MNSFNAKLPTHSKCPANNGGDYVTEGMTGMQQSILGVSTPAA
ncbi:hypothetical protein [Oleiharenicola lentus]